MIQLDKVIIRYHAFRATLLALNLTIVNDQTKESIKEAVKLKNAKLTVAFFNRLLDRAKKGQLEPSVKMGCPVFKEQLNTTIAEAIRICIISCDNCDYPLQELRKLAECLAGVTKQIAQHTQKVKEFIHPHILN